MKTAIPILATCFGFLVAGYYIFGTDPFHANGDERRESSDEIAQSVEAALVDRFGALDEELRANHEAARTAHDALARRVAALEAELERRAAAEVAESSEMTGSRDDSDAGSLDGTEPTKDEILGEALATITDSSARHGQKQEAWKRIAERGLLDDAVGELEARAEAYPQDADAQSDLGNAYIQKIFSVDGAAKGIWSMKANAAYDKALAVDDHHWTARFSKAVNYSFNPPVFGLQGKAIEQFEILIDQQEASGQSESRFDQPYLLLGNLYSNQGKDAKAREVWQRGSEQLPDSSELAERVRPTEENLSER